MISATACADPAAGSIIAASLAPFQTLAVGPPTSLEEAQRAGLKSSTHVTFKASIKSSGYGAQKVYRPDWAVKSASRAAAGGGSGFSFGAEPAPPYPRLTPLPEREVTRDFFAAAGLPRGSDVVTPTGRVLTTGLTGQRAAGAPLSAIALPVGPLTSLSFSPGGDALCAAGEGVASAVVRLWGDGAGGARLCAGAATQHGGGAGGGAARPPAPPCWSAGVYAGLVSRLAQAGGGGAATRAPAAPPGPPSRLLLVVAGGGEHAGLFAAGGSAGAQPVLTVRARGGCDMAGGSAGGAFPAPLSAACFAYVDRLALVACGAAIFAFTFSLGGLDEGGEGGGGGAAAGRRRAQARRCACVGSWEVEGGVTVLRMAALNDLRSPLLVAACSDRSIRVFDLSRVGGGGDGGGGAPPEVARVPGAHERAIHTLALPVASAHADVAAPSLDCVLSGATDGGGLVRLWDLRSAKCARQLAGAHVSRALPGGTGAALSPCAVFVAVGSEEKRAVVYDLRTEGAVARVGGASDAVTAVAWHPRAPCLATGSADGGVRMYAPGAGAP
jgi:hypothetical protein